MQKQNEKWLCVTFYTIGHFIINYVFQYVFFDATSSSSTSFVYDYE